MGDRTGYARDLLTPVRHVATELDRVSPEALSIEALAANYRHPNHADLTRVQLHEGCTTDDEATRWLIKTAIAELDAQVTPNGNGGYKLAKPFEDLKYKRSKIRPWVKTDEHDEKRALKALSNALREDSSGLRRVDPKRVEAIKQSVAEHGILPGHPVLVSHQRGGEVLILDGRHRLQVDPNWPRLKVTGKSVEELLLIARNANAQDTLGQPWSKKDLEHLDEQLTAAGVIGSSREAARDRIRQELLIDASRSNRAITKIVGGSHHTVQAVRADLESTGQIAQYFAKGGQSGGKGITAGKPAEPSAPPVESEPEPAGTEDPEPVPPKPFTETKAEGPSEERHETGATLKPVHIKITDTDWAEFVRRAKPSAAAVLGELVERWLA